jgi:hypothetical protein
VWLLLRAHLFLFGGMGLKRRIKHLSGAVAAGIFLYVCGILGSVLSFYLPKLLAR